MENISVARA